MKKALLLLGAFVILTISSFSQTVYLADTAFTTDIGYGGAPASCRPYGVYYLGWQMGRVQGTWLADVFTVPAGNTWIFDTVIVYGVQYNSGPVSTFLNCNLQIYDGTPGLGGNVIWGDTSTNVLIKTGFTGVYCVDTISSNGGLLSTRYPLMYLKLYLSTPANLSAGTYWLSWSAAGSLSGIPFSPVKVLPGRLLPPNQMGRQVYGGSWHYMIDSGHVMGMDMIIKASANLSIHNINEPGPFMLSQNAPNPFKESTNISFYLQKNSNVTLSIYNAMGQLVNTLIDGNMNSGNHQLAFNAGDLPAGIYYYQLKASMSVDCKQMQILR